MADKLQLGITITADGAAAERALGKVKDQLNNVKKSAKDVTDSAKAASAGFKGIESAASVAARAMTGFGAAFSVSAIYQTVAEFERLHASLKTVTGSITGATNAMDMIRGFAAETPYDVQQVTEAFIALKSLGLDASESSLRSFGNTAASMGKPMMQFVKAVADASTNEFERLKEFGIKTKQEADSVTFTFQGSSKTIAKNAAEIQNYLIEIGNTKFASGMADQMDTMNGALSNLKDSIANLVDLLANMGVSRYIKQDFQVASEIIGDFTKRLNAAFGSGLQAQIDGMTVAVKNLKEEVYNMEQTQGTFWDRLFGSSDEIAQRKSELEGMESRLKQLQAQQAAQVGSVGAQAEAASQSLEKLGVVQRKIYEEAVRQKVNPAFALAIANQESRFNQSALSPKGAMGVMQLMPDTAKSLGVDPAQLEDNIKGGVLYLKQMLDTFKNDMRIAAAAYNSGPNRQSLREGRVPAIKETQDYVKKVAAFYEQWKLEIGGGITPFADPKDLQKDADAFYSITAGAIDNQTKLEDAAGQTRLARQKVELARLKAAMEADMEAFTLTIKTSIDTQGIETATAAIDAAEAKQAAYLKQMAAIGRGDNTEAELSAQREIAAIDRKIAAAKELNQWEEDGAKLQTERKLAVENLAQVSMVSAEKDIGLQQALAENHAKYDAMRKDAAVENLKYQQQITERAQQSVTAEAAAQKSIIDGNVERLRSDAAIAEAARGQQAERLTGIAALQAASDNIRSSLVDQLAIIEAEKQATLDKLTIDYAVIDNQMQALEVQKSVTVGKSEQLEIEKQIAELQAEQDQLLRKSLDTINQTAAEKAKAQTSAQGKLLEIDIKQFKEAQLEMNAFWDQTMERIEQATGAWTELTKGQTAGIDRMLVGLAKYGKSISQIAEKYKELASRGKTLDDLGNTEFSETMRATAQAVADTALGMRSMFDVGTDGFKAMTALATAALVAQDLMNISDGVAAVLKQLKEGDPYTATLRAAVVAAQVMSLGVHIMGGLSGMGSGKSATDQAKDRQSAAGTGTVLGDTAAKSDSIANSLAIIRDNSSNDLSYSAAMLRALEGIEAALSGAAASIFTTVKPFIDMIGKNMGFGSKMGLDIFQTFDKAMTDWGLAFPVQKLGDILKNGLNDVFVYMDVTRTWEIMGQAISSSTKTYAAEAGDDVTRQFKKIIFGIRDALVEGGKAFGLTASDFRDRLRNFVVDIGMVSFMDMNGEAAQEQISAIFSGLTDRIAKAFMPGLNKFVKLGEGYAETFFRVAEGINRSKVELEQLGMTAIDYTKIVNKQGDVAAEIARQTIAAQGQLAYGVRQYVDELTGSAEDIIAAYKKLVEASAGMNTAGFSDTFLNRAMINAAGGLDAFVSAIQAYNDEFLTEAQRISGASTSLSEQFARLGVTMPVSKDAFTALMMGIDQTTEAGQKLFGALLQLSPAFADLANRIQGIKDKYEAILNPFGKFGAQIKTVGDDFTMLIDDAMAKIRADGPGAQRITDLTGQKMNLLNGVGGQKELLDKQFSNETEIAKLQAKIVDEQNKGKKANKELIRGWKEQISALQSANSMIGLQLNAVIGKIQGLDQQIKDAIAANDAALAGQLGAEKQRMLEQAGQAMTATLEQVFTEIQATLDAAQQRLEAAVNFQKTLATQIANLQGPEATAALMGARAVDATQAVDDYWAALSAGQSMNSDEALRLLGESQQAIMDDYNAQVALSQQAAQAQAKALQDNLQIQIDAINAATTAQVDAINTASQAQIDAINATAEAQVAAVNAQLDASTKAAQKAQDATLKGLQTQLQAAQQLTAAYKQIAEYAKSLKLGSLTNLSPEAKLAEAQRQYQETLAKAKSGDADAAAKLSGASDAYLQAAQQYYGSGTQYSNIFDGVQAAMTSVGGLDGGNPDSIQAHIDQLNESFQAGQEALREAAQQQIKSIQTGAQDQIKAAQEAAQAQIKAIQEAAQAQIKALQDNIGQQIADLNDPNKNLALKALKDATVAKLQALADKAEETRKEAAKQYEAARTKAAEDMRRAAQIAQDQLAAIGLVAGFNSQQVAALTTIARSIDPNFTMPAPVVPPTTQALATGGYAHSGMALVGEKGPELVRFERPAQVLSASQTREALNGESPKTFAALEAIKQELKAIVVTQSNANPQLIERLAGIEDRLNKMERNQRINANN